MVLTRTLLWVSVLGVTLFFSGCADGNRERRGQKQQKDSVECTDSLNSALKVGRDFILRVYLDNSASMQGYVNGATEFVDFVDAYVSNIAIKFGKQQGNSFPHCMGVEFYLLDTVEHLWAGGYEDITKSFLLPKNFKVMQSETSAMIKRLIALQEDKVVTLFFSDGMFTSRKNDVGRMPFEIRTPLTKRLGQDTIDTKLIRLISTFDGLYYPPKNKNGIRSFKGQRPYLCWIMGHPKILSVLASKSFIDDLHVPQSGYNEYVGIGVVPVEYEVFRTQHGYYDVKRNSGKPLHELSEVKFDKRGRFVVRVGFNLNTSLIASEYILDPLNYEVTPSDFDLSVERVEKKGAYDYVLTLSLKQEVKSIPVGDIIIAFRRNNQDWSDFSEKEGIRQLDGKTYGLEHWVDGIQRAYELQYGKNLMELKIKIEK